MGVFVGPNSPSPGTDFEGRADRIGMPVRSSNPSPASAGDMYFNSSDSMGKFYDGTQWVDMGGGAADITPNISGGDTYNPSDGLYQVRIFESSGTLTISNVDVVAEYVLVAGGGSSNGRTGAGAGGVLVGSATLTPGSYPITIGAGAVRSPAPAGAVANGGNSTFNGLTAYGGGAAAAAGGSGGGWAGPALPTTGTPAGGYAGCPGQGHPGSGGSLPGQQNNGGGGGYAGVAFPYFRVTDRDVYGSGGAAGSVEWGLPTSVCYTNSDGMTYFGGGGGAANPFIPAGGGFGNASWGNGGNSYFSNRKYNCSVPQGLRYPHGSDGVLMLRFKKTQ